jgi:hypothetical protein
MPTLFYWSVTAAQTTTSAPPAGSLPTLLAIALPTEAALFLDLILGPTGRKDMQWSAVFLFCTICVYSASISTNFPSRNSTAIIWGSFASSPIFSPTGSHQSSAFFIQSTTSLPNPSSFSRRTPLLQKSFTSRAIKTTKPHMHAYLFQPSSTAMPTN